MIRVLLVEDSVVQREILRRILSADDTFTIVAEARNGREAVRLVEEHRPDVVVMDIHMPDMNGVEATREIMQRFPVPIVITSATLKKHDIDLGVEAWSAGAVAVIAKPEGAVLLNLEKMAVPLRDEIVRASRVRFKTTTHVAKRESSKTRFRVGPMDVIGICASTGGPPVLVEILESLPRPFAVPILLVQHITSGFEESFANWLSQRTGQPVAIAVDGQRLSPGIWLGAPGKHLALRASRHVALREPQGNDIHCPSGNVMFTSLAKHVGSRAAGVLLTGMGDDGAHGLLELKQAGGTTIIQDEVSSFIWGMPKAGKELQAAIHELNPHDIGLLLTAMNR